MAFWLSKLLWVAVNPGSLLLIFLVLGAVLTRTRWRRLGAWLVGLTTTAFLAIAVLPTAWPIAVLEDRFPAVTTPPARVDGIVVLGGAGKLRVTERRGQVSLNEHAERMTAFVALARRYPDARLVFTGGSGSLRPGPLRETDLARRLFADLGLDPARVVFERESRNTYENAVNTKALVEPGPGETWLLVTSAMHMPRAVGVFRAVGWEVTPYPVDYVTTGDPPALEWRFALDRGLRSLSVGTHEWLGLVAYYLMGRTPSLFPGPRPASG